MDDAWCMMHDAWCMMHDDGDDDDDDDDDDHVNAVDLDVDDSDVKEAVGLDERREVVQDTAEALWPRWRTPDKTMVAKWATKINPGGYPIQLSLLVHRDPERKLVIIPTPLDFC